MNINLTACNQARPDRRAITKLLEEIASGVDESLAREFTDILINGSPVEIELDEKKVSSSLQRLRKMKIDYEIEE